MRRTYTRMYQQRCWTLVSPCGVLYLTPIAGPGDLLKHAADILSQHLSALGIYSHLVVRLVLFRHCLFVVWAAAWREGSLSFIRSAVIALTFLGGA